MEHEQGLGSDNNCRDTASERAGEDEDKTYLLYNFAHCPLMGKDHLLVKHILSSRMKEISEEDPHILEFIFISHVLTIFSPKDLPKTPILLSLFILAIFCFSSFFVKVANNFHLIKSEGVEHQEEEIWNHRSGIRSDKQDFVYFAILI